MNIPDALRDIRLFCNWAKVYEPEIYMEHVKLVLEETILLGLSVEGNLETKIFACSAILLGQRSRQATWDHGCNPSRDSIVVTYFCRQDRRGLGGSPRTERYFHMALANMRCQWLALQPNKTVA